MTIIYNEILILVEYYAVVTERHFKLVDLEWRLILIGFFKYSNEQKVVFYFLSQVTCTFNEICKQIVFSIYYLTLQSVT